MNLRGNYSGGYRIIQATLSSFSRLDLRIIRVDPDVPKHSGVSSPVCSVI